jgi:2-polyprenyl-3-methyl-5-hydroxy-6-metoxy-1,4-benzoquinol methylase
LGYGGNQKIGYDYVISKGYDYVILLHGDGQYAPEILGDLLKPILNNEAEIIFGSRMMNTGEARRGGMPLYKYLGNKILTKFENYFLKMNLSEFHSGYRIYSCKILSKIPYHLNTDDFHFDTEIIIQLKELGVNILELPIPTYYGDELCYVNGLKYAKNVFKSVINYTLHKKNLKYVEKFDIAPEKYQKKSGEYSSHQKIVKLIPANKKVLDLGGGEGLIADQLFKKNCQIVEIDSRKPKTDLPYEYIVANLEEGINLNNNYKFDYVILADIIEHLMNAKKVLSDLKKYLDKDGKIIISTGNIGFWYFRLSLLFGQFNYTSSGILDSTHVRLYTLKNFLKLIESSGFKVVKKEYTILPYELIFPRLSKTWLIKIFSSLSYLLAKILPRFFAYQFIVVAELKDYFFVKNDFFKNINKPKKL